MDLNNPSDDDVRQAGVAAVAAAVQDGVDAARDHEAAADLAATATQRPRIASRAGDPVDLTSLRLEVSAGNVPIVMSWARIVTGESQWTVIEKTVADKLDALAKAYVGARASGAASPADAAAKIEKIMSDLAAANAKALNGAAA